jgi:Mn2+/Fe2+ NRAMP family transporter
MLALVVTNFGNVVAEFAGVASSLELFGVSKYIVVPLAATVVWVMVVRGTYSSVEKIFLLASGFYVAYIVAGLLAHPDWKAAAIATVSRPSTIGIRNYGYLFMVVGLVGTTIAPWMQFYLQASIVEKGITPKQYRTSRWDVILGCLFTDVVAWFIIVACAATLYATGLALRSVDSADLHVLCRLRRAGVRIRAGQGVSRSAGLLLALHRADRRGRRRPADSAVSARARHGAVASRQRRGPAVRAHLHAAANQ